MLGLEMSFLYNKNLLNDPKIVIEGTEETCNSTEWHEKMINMNSDIEEDIITTAVQKMVL